MNIDKLILALTGSIVLISVALAHFVNPYWLIVTAFIGFVLFQAAFTGFCPSAMLLKKMGIPCGSAFK